MQIPKRSISFLIVVKVDTREWSTGNYFPMKFEIACFFLSWIVISLVAKNCDLAKNEEEVFHSSWAAILVYLDDLDALVLWWLLFRFVIWPIICILYFNLLLFYNGQHTRLELFLSTCNRTVKVCTIRWRSKWLFKRLRECVISSRDSGGNWLSEYNEDSLDSEVDNVVVE